MSKYINLGKPVPHYIVGEIGPTGPTGVTGATGYLGPTGYSGPTGTQGISAGAVYYFNNSVSTDVSLYSDLNRVPDGLSESTLITNVTSGDIYMLIGNFISPVGDPTVPDIPSGIWSMKLWAQVDDLTYPTYIYYTV